MNAHSDLIKPGDIIVIKRQGHVVPYDVTRIRNAIAAGMLDAYGKDMAGSAALQDKISFLTDNVHAVITRRLPSGGALSIEEIQDLVELAMMRAGEHRAARLYVLYREKRAQERAARGESAIPAAVRETVEVTLPDGTKVDYDLDQVNARFAECARGLAHVNVDAVARRVRAEMFPGMALADLYQSFILAARVHIEEHPEYSQLTARLLLLEKADHAARLVAGRGIDTFVDLADAYPALLQEGIRLLVREERLAPALETHFDLPRLASALLPERDLQLTYAGLQTLYDRYFVHVRESRIELPQTFLMRVAMGLALEEDDPTARAIEFYTLLSSFDYLPSTPTLFNAGTLHSQLSSCYLTTVPDHLEGIYGAIRDNAMLSKWAGGLGNDWTPVRALGSYIKGTNGKSQGVVPFLKVVNDTAVAVNQGGKRKGAVCAYLETWHLDIEEFLELRKNTGDDRRRTHDMNTANWIPDLFMKRVMEGGDWTLFSPNSVPDLHDLYGEAFEKAYTGYELLAREGKIKPSKVVKAEGLWRKMLSMLFETGHPWLTFKDPCNLRSPQMHCGVVHSSNLCTEITLNTSAGTGGDGADGEIAVCNLGSVNLAAHVVDGRLDLERLRRTVRTAVRMLDNVIDINFYAVPQARNANLRHRPVGLGLMGFQDALYKLRLPYASPQAVEFADASMEALSYFAIEASADLARERGAYESFQGSAWSLGILPLDSIAILRNARGTNPQGQPYLQMDAVSVSGFDLDWAALRSKVQGGMRNSNVMAIAPTATISIIAGCSQSIEPTFQNLYVKSNLSGEFTTVNSYLIADLISRGLWDEVMLADLKHFEGDVSRIERIPADLKALYQNAFQVEARWLVEAAARRQKWIDQAQSLNLYIDEANGKKLDITYKMAWLLGLKTTYYLRARSATNAEKSTGRGGELNAVKPGTMPAADSFVQAADVPKACSLDNPDCEACQ